MRRYFGAIHIYDKRWRQTICLSYPSGPPIWTINFYSNEKSLNAAYAPKIRNSLLMRSIIIRRIMLLSV